MAGSFEYELEYYEIAKAVGEDRLFPAIRNGADVDVAISGFSCRHQVEHHTDARPKRLVEWLAEGLDTS